MATNPLIKPKPKKKKPQEIRPPMGASINSDWPGSGPPKGIPAPRPSTPPPAPKAPTAAAPAAQPPAPAPKKLTAVPPGFIPPQTTQGANMRSTAESTYTGALRSGRQGIVDAALRLGSPEIIAALRADPNFAEYAGVLDKGLSDPSSQMSLAAKDEKEGLTNTDLNTLGGNTYFSSRRLEDRQKLSDDFTAARAGYLRDYNTGYNGFTGAMGQAKGQYEADVRDADIFDANTWLANQPEPIEAPAPVETPAGPAPGGALPTIPGMTPQQVQQAVTQMGAPGFMSDMPGSANNKNPKPGYSFVQKDGSRAGLSYNVVMKGGVKYRFYENGDKVKVG